MEFNIFAILVAAFSTLVVGFIWYNPKVFGNIWMRESGTTEEKMKGANMALIFGLSLFYAFLISFMLNGIVIHQNTVVSLIGGPPMIETAKPSYAIFMADYKDAFRTFKHGALHGFMTALLLVLPVVGVNSLYERRSFKYVLIVSGYWMVAFMIMGGIICAWR